MYKLTISQATMNERYERRRAHTGYCTVPLSPRRARESVTRDNHFFLNRNLILYQTITLKILYCTLTRIVWVYWGGRDFGRRPDGQPPGAPAAEDDGGVIGCRV